MHPQLSTTLCVHCGNPARGEQFCCLGCRAVYKLLNESGLGRYYEIRNETAKPGALKPATLSHDTYAYLDDAAFRAKYARSSAAPAEACTMDFFLEGVHCAACLWLVEKLPALVSDVERSTLDLGKAVARVQLKAGGSFAPVARMLADLGYKPHAIEHDEQAEALLKHENRTWLVRMGVAGACAGNIMLLVIPSYSGLSGSLAMLFRWLSLALFLPVIFYSAVPFYKNAWASVRSRTISIDLPIVLAILFGALASVAHLPYENEHVYFDSLSALVFLLLASRYVLKRIQQNALQSSQLFQFLSPSFARRINRATGQLEEVAVSTLKAKDFINVDCGEILAADGTIAFGSGALNCALLTGESLPRSVGPGDKVFAGTVNEGAALQIEVEATGHDTRLGRILKQIENGNLKKAAIVTAADRTAKWFLVSVVAAALAVIFLAPTLSEGFSRALALAIVTCPCALALATPLTMTVALGKASRNGILVKGAETLEKIYHAGEIALDKTGTLTNGHFEVLSWHEEPGQAPLKQVVYALERRSKHPVARALVKYLDGTVQDPEILSHKETIGQGVEGRVDGSLYEIKPLRAGLGTSVGFYRDGALVGQARLGDRPRADAAASVAALGRLGLDTYVVSGDNRSAVAEVAAELGIAPARAIAEATPETKRQFVEAHPRALMIGDGANDAPALSTAYVGVAVQGSMEVSLRAADVYITRAGVAPVLALVEIARETMKTIHRNFAFSLFYNLAGGLAAATGHVTPLFAALLMPLSAFTVFSSSLLGTRKLRALSRVTT